MNSQDKISLTVYHRVGCHLCDQMVASLIRLQGEMDFGFELVDIDRNEKLRKRYDVDVPVVALDDEVLCCHFFDEESIRQAIEEHGSNQSPHS
ncbi:MAG: glutaredoxin family protein [Thiothrix sp.]|nr:glutaredoxin family protein [Thiothrix sp.]HPQ96395.1 glutaredoxin family protein [Thiolinea sp.]